MKKVLTLLMSTICINCFILAQNGDFSVQRLDLVIKQKDSLHLTSKFVISNFQKLEATFVNNDSSVLKDFSIKEVPVNSVQLRGQKKYLEIRFTTLNG